MKKIMRIAIMILLMTAGIAEAAKRITVVKDPDAPDIVYDKIIVNMRSPDYQFKMDMENDIKKYMGKRSGTEIVQAHTLFFPTRTYSPENIKEIINGTGADAVLTIEPAKSEIAKTTAKSADEKKGERKDSEKNYPSFVLESSVSMGGYLYDVQLFDVRAEKNVLYASIDKWSWDGKDMAKNLVQELLKSGFVQYEKPQSKPRQDKYSK